MSGNRLILVGLGSLIALATMSSTPAQACGGFFCSANAPVNQAAERIIFSKNADDTVTAVVQIQYSGPSEDFAWVLPVPGVPEVKVSSDLAFQRLQQTSNPLYNITTVVEGTCKRERGSGDQGSAPSVAFGPDASGEGGDVNILESGTVGPYDFVVIEPDASFAELGGVAVDWLTNEGYDVVPAGGDPQAIADLLGGYLQGGMNLLAFRLTKGNDNGTIRPIWITYASEQPMIPIRPTAVAANDDMGVLVWVLGEHRAVPINYKALELNEALIDWRTGGSNYNQVVVAAANEAGGQGFVTERAGAASDYEGVVLLEFERIDWDAFAMSIDALSSTDLLIESANRFSAWDGYRDVIERFLPAEIDVDSFLSCPSCERSRLRNAIEQDEIDKTAFVEALGEEVALPMIETQELILSRPYVTRLYTTLSAPEMDLDPLFDFNPDLPEATNIHNALQVVECGRRTPRAQAPSRFELEDGRVVRVAAGAPWPFVAGDEDAPPANSRVLELTTSGPGVVAQDNRTAIDEALARHNSTVPSPGCSCRVAGQTTHIATWSALGMFVLLMRVRRRFRAG